VRLSVIEADIGYSPDARLIKPYLNGKRLYNCITADDEEGWCDVYVTDVNGSKIVDGDELKIERLFGKVEFRIDNG
jgi:hypothetical protein